MARPDSILTQILDQLKLELKKIKTANGYATNIIDEAVFDQPQQWRSFLVYPAVVITYADGKNDLQPCRGSRRRQRIRLNFYLRSDETPAAWQIAELQTDLDYLVSQNPKLSTASKPNGLVVYWKVDSDRSTKGLLDPYEIWIVDLEMVYHGHWN